MPKELKSKAELTAHLESLPAEQVKQAFLELVKNSDRQNLIVFLRDFSPAKMSQAELSPQEKAIAYRAWAESHIIETPPLSDAAISRESIYSDERL
jgi:hypothetical protein